MPQPVQGAPRPDMRSTAAPSWWLPASLGSAVPFGVSSLAAGKGFMHGAMGPVPMVAGFANPWARSAQLKADSQYLANARGSDMSAGLPTFAKTPKTASVKLSRVGDRLAARLKMSAVVPPDPATVANMPYRLAGLGEDHPGLAYLDARNNAVGAPVGQATFGPLPAHQIPVIPYDEADRLRHELAVHEAQVANAARTEEVAAARAAEAAVAGRRATEQLSAEGMGAGKRALRFMGRGLSNPAVLAGLLGIPVALAGVAGIDALYRGASKGINHMAEGSRFDKAMEGLDPSAFGDPNFVDRWDTDRPALQADMRAAFGMLNKYSPGVAKDPILAREYMKRLQLDPRYKAPPEQYMRQVQGAIDMENAMQKARPSIFNEGGSYGSKVVTGRDIGY